MNVMLLSVRTDAGNFLSGSSLAGGEVIVRERN